MRQLSYILLCSLSLTGCKLGKLFTDSSQALMVQSPAEATDLAPEAGIVRVRLVAEAQQDAQGRTRYTYNQQSPGPTIVAQLGDTIEVELVNQLADPTTIHWHGVKVPFEMDGVTWMRAPIAPGESFRYRFQVNTSGTFWYHPHFNTEHQVEGGLYGALIVIDPTEPRADHELVLFADQAGEILAPGPRPSHGHGKSGAKWLLNGLHQPEYQIQGGQSLRIRLLNVSKSGYLSLTESIFEQIAGDQGLLAQKRPADSLLLGPGDRAELLFYASSQDARLMNQPYSLNGGPVYGEPQPLLQLKVVQPGPVPEPLAFQFSQARPSPDPGHLDILYALAGSDRTGRWLINGERFPQVTIETLRQGRTAVIEVRNLSPTEHPFHLHGMSFEVLSLNGTVPAFKTIEDTVNLRIGDRLRLQLLADNPGDWMVHCHILAHAEDGMMTVLRVAP